MSDTREKLKKIKKAIRESHKEILDIEHTKEILLQWLSQFNFPKYPNASCWEECIEIFPDPSVDCKRPTDGLKLRLLLKLYTSNHRYVISIIECFELDAIGKGIISVHVNLDQTEYQLQKNIELGYKDSFDSSLKPKQTLFVEPFNLNALTDSLNNAGLAILGNELTGNIADKKLALVKNLTLQHVSFPETE